MNKIKIAFVQHAFQADYKQNIQKNLSGIQEAKQKGADCVVLSELHTNLYFCQTESPEKFDLAEPLDGPTAQQLSAAAKQNDIVIVGSIFEKRAPGIFHNTAVVFDKDGSLAGFYRKMHIPDDPGYYEKYYFTPGDTGFEPIQTSIGRLGVLVCWDQWYPEAARIMALKGADVLIYPTAIGWDPADTQAEQAAQCDAWITIQRAHSIANHLPVIVCNRYGFEKAEEHAEAGQLFWGNSFITDAHGQIVAQAPDNSDSVEVCEVDKANTERLRKIWPYFRDRRIDAYEDLLNRYCD